MGKEIEKTALEVLLMRFFVTPTASQLANDCIRSS